MSKIDELLAKMKKPQDIESKMQSTEGLIYKQELERIGSEIAKAEYNLQLWKLRQAHKTIRFREFLGYEITQEEKDNVSAIQEFLEQRGEL